MITTLQRRLKEHSEEKDEGFTLIELLVVLLIMGILLAIAIPTYLSVTGSANTTAAQSNLQTALTASKAYYVDNNQTFNGLDATSSLTGTGLTYQAGATTSPSTISYDVPAAQSDGGVLFLAAQATNGNCYVVVDVETPLMAAIGSLSLSDAPGVWYGEFAVSSSTTCSAATAETASITYASTAAAGWPAASS